MISRGDSAPSAVVSLDDLERLFASSVRPLTTADIAFGTCDCLCVIHHHHSHMTVLVGAKAIGGGAAGSVGVGVGVGIPRAGECAFW